MLNTKLRGNQFIGSAGKICKRFLPYMRMAGILVM